MKCYIGEERYNINESGDFSDKENWQEFIQLLSKSNECIIELMGIVMDKSLITMIDDKIVSNEEYLENMQQRIIENQTTIDFITSKVS
jgi:hypothetical protein